MRNVFFGETGPVALPKPTGATASAREADAGTSPDSRKSRDPQGPKTAAPGATAPTRAERKAEKARVAVTHHRVSVTSVDDSTLVVRLDQAILGYIHRAGTVYVALRGATLGLAVEVGQSVSRARAFTLLQSDSFVRVAGA